MNLTFPTTAAVADYLEQVRTTVTSPALPLQIARYQRDRILQQTARGLDLHSHPFRAYTPAYGRRRTRAGHPTTPNLRFTGAMLAHLQPRTTATGAQLAFTTPEDSAKALANQAIRPFLGFTPDDLHALATQLAQTLAP